MLRLFLLVLLSFIALGCNESTEDSVPEEESVVVVDIPEKSTTLTEFSKLFSTISDVVILNKESFFNGVWKSIPSLMIEDWIHPYSETVKHFDDEKWLALLYRVSDEKKSFCLAQIHNEDVRVYLLQFLNDEQGELIHLGNISTFNYKDSSQETGEEYDFDVTDCENLKLEFKNDSLYTTCERYTATIGKDWRVDQNLYVNDTVKLPVIESSYSLY